MRFDVAETGAVAWKNGGGTTRELARHERAGRLVWRLSLADIGQDGPFSAFPGFMRIHTIVSGAGLELHGGTCILQARPLQPLHFDGGLALTARLADGPCQALNVIYDPARVSAEVIAFRDDAVGARAGDVLFTVAGSLRVQGEEPLAAGQGVVLEAPATGQVTGGSALRIRFTALPEDR